MSRVFDGDSANVLQYGTTTMTLSGRLALGYFLKPNPAGFTEYTSTSVVTGFFDSSSNNHGYYGMATDADDGTAVWSARMRPRLATSPDLNLYGSANDVPPDVWTGVLLVSDLAGKQFTVYIGDSSTSYTSALQTWTTDWVMDRFICGAGWWVAGPDGAYNGKLARVAVWTGLSSDLSAAEIDGWMTGTVPRTSDLYGYYPLETTSLEDEGGSMGTLVEAGTVAHSTDNPIIEQRYLPLEASANITPTGLDLTVTLQSDTIAENE